MPQKIHLLISIPSKDPESFTLDKDKVTLGRSPDNDVQVLVSELSTNHCEFHSTNDGYEIADLNSTNGTKVNGDSVGSSRVALKENDIILLGETILAYVVEAEDGAELDFMAKINEIKESAKSAIPAAAAAVVAPAAAAITPTVKKLSPPSEVGAPPAGAPVPVPGPPAPAVPVPGGPPSPLSPPPAPGVAAGSPSAPSLAPPPAPTGPPTKIATPAAVGPKTISLEQAASNGPPSGPLPVPQPVGGGTPPPALKVPTGGAPPKKLAVPPPSAPPKP